MVSLCGKDHQFIFIRSLTEALVNSGIMPWIVDIRRRLHMTPELMYDLNETAAIVRAALDELRIEYKYPVARSGIVATIGSGSEPVVVLRVRCFSLNFLRHSSMCI